MMHYWQLGRLSFAWYWDPVVWEWFRFYSGVADYEMQLGPLEVNWQKYPLDWECHVDEGGQIRYQPPATPAPDAEAEE